MRPLEYQIVSVVFLFGAGASFGNPDCAPTPPPLGADLFRALQRRGGIAGSVTGPLSDLFAAHFEHGMEEFYRVRQTDTAAFIREMADYFVRFKAGPRNFYQRLVTIVRHVGVDAILSTINYDVLVEQGISDAGLQITYSITREPSTVTVLKPHGSCNFLPETHGNVWHDVRFGGKFIEGMLEADVRVAWSADEVLRFCREQDSLAPAMAMYARGKQVLFCPGFVSQQLKMWQEEIARAEAIYVIGVRVNEEDRHLWSPLAASPAPIYYVGREWDEFEAWEERKGRLRGAPLAHTFADCLPMLADHLRQ